MKYFTFSWLINILKLIDISKSNLFIKLFKQNENKASRFDYLDAYRGLLAIIVVISHSKIKHGCEFHDLILLLSAKAVDGFFVLSAFLLTYRLTKELNKCDNYKAEILTIIKYAIRRFFRIYLVFAFYVFLIEIIPSKYTIYHHKPLAWYNSLMLQLAGYTHLWTIGAEVKYYFLIPIFCYISSKLKKYTFLFLFSFVLSLILNEYLNFFNITNVDFDVEHRFYLKARFTVFCFGSLAALFLLEIEKHLFLQKIIQNYYIQYFISIFSLVLIVIIVKYHDLIGILFLKQNTMGKYLSLLTLLMTIGSPNYLTDLLSSANLLKKCGKFSFGIYLLHPMVGTIKFYYTFKVQTEYVLIVIVLSFITGFLFYYLIEKPLILISNKLCEKIEAIKYLQLNNSSEQMNDITQETTALIVN